jgi:trimeric autotransporter adhesin
MKRILIVLFAGLVVFAIAADSWAQTPSVAQVSSVPRLVQFSGTLKDAGARPVSGVVSVIFAIYGEQDGGTALWSETQNVTADASGHYSTMLGIASAAGLPDDLFAAAQSRWLGVRIVGQAELPRVLLVSVPYALRAADADTVGGLPASAFLLAAPQNAAAAETTASTQPQAAATGVTADATPTGSGTASFLPLWTTASNLGTSGIFQSSGGLIGINTATPAVTLDVAGNMYIRGGFTMPPQGTATATTSFNSHSYFFSASAYNSSSKAAEDQTFAWEASALDNNTATPSATLKLRFAEGTGASNPTGFQIASNGILSFATGQTFPGTVTDVTAGTGLTGGGTSSNVTVNVDNTKVPLLANANTFSATQTITNGDLNLPATTGPNVGVLNIGGVPFLHGYNQSSLGIINVFVGDAGNFTTSGADNTGIGVQALAANTTGNYNTAAGQEALYNNSSGGGNTASGTQALLYSTSGTLDAGFGYGALRSNSTGNFNTGIGGNAGNIPDTSLGTGSYNTALGAYASASTGTLTNTTAVGANAIVGQNNSLVLGNTTSTPGAEFVNVGIGTGTPRSAVEASVNASGALGPTLTLTNSGSGSSTAAAIDFNTYLPSSAGTYNPGARIAAVDDGNSDFGTNLVFYRNEYGQPNNGLRQDMVIDSQGRVGIGSVVPGTPDVQNNDAQLVVMAQTGWDAIYGVGAISVSGYGTTGVVGLGGDGSFTDNGGIGGAFYPGSVGNVEENGDAIYGGTENQFGTLAGLFNGDVVVSGMLSAGTKNFKIDDPLDPANKYLVHSSVESSEMMDIYSGNVLTDQAGSATVTLPSWFEVLNTDFRYQLTTIGQDAHAWISQEVQSGKFAIRTNTPSVKVSWQITAVRQDAFAKAHPQVVEQEKPASERGFYMNPELFGQPRQKQIAWGRHPEEMRRIEAQRQAIRQARNSQTAAGTARSPGGQPASAVNRNFAHPAAPVLKPAAPAKPVAVKPVGAVKP